MSPLVPGTIGTVVALPIAFALHTLGSDALYLSVAISLLFVGVWASQVTGQRLGNADHGAIVIDEVVAFLIVLFFFDKQWLYQLWAFFIFRFFDIVKPPPIGHIDRTIKNGLGVMLDDLLAAGYTLLILLSYRFMFK